MDTASRKTQREDVQGDPHRSHISQFYRVTDTSTKPECFSRTLSQALQLNQREPGCPRRACRWTIPQEGQLMGMKRVGPPGDEGLRESFGFEVTLSVLFHQYPHTPRRKENEKLTHRGTKSQLGGDAKGLPQIQGQGALHSLKPSRAAWGDLVPTSKR